MVSGVRHKKPVVFYVYGYIRGIIKFSLRPGAVAVSPGSAPRHSGNITSGCIDASYAVIYPVAHIQDIPFCIKGKRGRPRKHCACTVPVRVPAVTVPRESIHYSAFVYYPYNIVSAVAYIRPSRQSIIRYVRGRVKSGCWYCVTVAAVSVHSRLRVNIIIRRNIYFFDFVVLSVAYQHRLPQIIKSYTVGKIKFCLKRTARGVPDRARPGLKRRGIVIKIYAPYAVI